MKFINTKYEDFTTDEFLTDEFFLEWVKKGNNDAKTFWEDWLSLHPHKTVEVLEAKNLILSANYIESKRLSKKEELMLYERIIRNKYDNDQQNTLIRNISFKSIYKVAAVITFLLLCSVAYYQ